MRGVLLWLVQKPKSALPTPPSGFLYRMECLARPLPWPRKAFFIGFLVSWSLGLLVSWSLDLSVPHFLIPVPVTGIQPAQVLGLKRLFPATQTRVGWMPVTGTATREWGCTACGTQTKWRRNSFLAPTPPQAVAQLTRALAAAACPRDPLLPQLCSPSPPAHNRPPAAVFSALLGRRDF